MNRQEKAREIDTLNEALRAAPPTFVMSFSGLTVSQISSLRKKVRATSSRYRVVKNRLMLRALRETPLERLSTEFRGPTAIAYSERREPASLARILDEFARENRGLRFKAGFVDGRVIGPREFRELADLPPREVLMARFLGALQAPMARLLRVLKAPAGDLVRVLDRIASSKESAGGAAKAEPPPS
ncbi:MAG: 50S ribosomal protein L10 [Acidobacteriota bacterium]